MEWNHRHFTLYFLLLCRTLFARSSNIAPIPFDGLTDFIPAAFGDFNADELTDLFVITENRKTVQILPAEMVEPFFSINKDLQCNVTDGHKITSVVPGDFDGDAVMDFLVTSVSDKLEGTHVFINYGSLTNISCAKEPVFTLKDEPLVIDYDQNMTSDLLGWKNDGTYVFWKFSKNRTPPVEIPLDMGNNVSFVWRVPHSHAFVDLNEDNSPDLFLTGNDGFGIWLFDNVRKTFRYNKTIPYPANIKHSQIGQTLFMDVETADSLHALVPVCEDAKCVRSAIYALSGDSWINLNVSFVNDANQTWGFVPRADWPYTDAVTLRAGDFDNDGYVDMLATLSNAGQKRTFLLRNVPCAAGSCAVRRTFEVNWRQFRDYNRDAVAGAFYDFAQDGILDLVLVYASSGQAGRYRMAGFRNGIDYDANFVKVMVISNQPDRTADTNPLSGLSSPSTFGLSLAGPTIQYRTTTRDGQPQTGVAVQLPQSAHFALHLPFTIFGLGRTPNFVEDLTVGMFNRSRTWFQIIPNSQLVIVPEPPQLPTYWRMQLFVTPSKIILETVIALTGTCLVIAVLIGLLHWKERREDRFEKLQEAHRFHFDAM